MWSAPHLLSDVRNATMTCMCPPPHIYVSSSSPPQRCAKRHLPPWQEVFGSKRPQRPHLAGRCRYRSLLLLNRSLLLINRPLLLLNRYRWGKQGHSHRPHRLLTCWRRYELARGAGQVSFVSVLGLFCLCTRSLLLLNRSLLI
jgi:hypothetical protein